MTIQPFPVPLERETSVCFEIWDSFTGHSQFETEQILDLIYAILNIVSNKYYILQKLMEYGSVLAAKQRV